jgi:hypothetical protein
VAIDGISNAAVARLYYEGGDLGSTIIAFGWITRYLSPISQVTEYLIHISVIACGHIDGITWDS